MTTPKLAWADQSDTQPVMVSVSTFKGRQRVDIRRYWTNVNDGKLYPTKKGVSIPFEEFVEALDSLYTLDEDVAAMMDAWMARFI